MNTTLAAAVERSGLLHRWSFGHVGNSTQAYDTEWLYIFIVWVNIISMAVLMVPMCWWIWKYRRQNQKDHYQVSPAHNTPLELAWSIIPLLIMVPIFFWGFEGYVDKLASPTDAEEIRIQGQKWSWTMIYKNGATPGDYIPNDKEHKSGVVEINQTKQETPIMAVPANRPVRLIMTSSDVLHAFFISDFRTKMDVTPNRYTSMWFEAREPTIRHTDYPGQPWMKKGANGEPEFVGHKIFCAEYCGDNHSEMTAGLVVLEQKEYEALIHEWATKMPTGLPHEVGAVIAKRRACVTCHSADGSKNTGPTWKDLFGSTQQYADGSSQKIDENALREAILYSQKKIVKTYPSSMPVYAGQIKAEEIDVLIAYIKFLAGVQTPAPAADGASKPAAAPTTPATPAPGH